MKRIAYMIVGAIALAGGVAHMSRVPAWAGGAIAPASGIAPPPGYRDWRLISVAHEGGKLNDIRAILGNDIAIEAYREGTLPFPDGAIIARLAWEYISSEENDKAFGGPQSFVAGAPTNVQFMIKDSAEHASTGGWRFVQFNDGKAVEAAQLSNCYTCHVPVKARDFVFTRYSP
jgi:hypothetical protein